MTEITQDELREFFARHKGICPFCNGTEWSVSPVEQPVLTIFTDPNGALPFPPPSLKGYAALCVGCGFFRVHEAGIVKMLIDEAKASGNN